MFPTFANPEWLWCLLLLLPLAGLRVWSHLRSKKGTRGLISPRLTGELIVGARQWSRWVVFSLQVLALALLILALARPQWGYEVTETESESRNIIIAIDTSRSMLANDLNPDRMTRAKLAAQDIVMSLPDDRIGLIAFAGKPFLQAPLTLDHDAVMEVIQQFDTEIIPRGGSNLTEAANLAVEVFEKASSPESALIIFSDGEALEGRDQLDTIVEDAKEVGLMVVTIGVGTSRGSIIPEPDENGRAQEGIFVRDAEGNVVRTRLDPTALQELSATLGGGVYLDLASTTSVAKSVPDALRQIKANRGVSEARRKPIDRFAWPLSFALVLIVSAWLLPGTSRLIQRLMAKPTQSSGDAPLAATVRRNASAGKANGKKKTPPPLPAKRPKAGVSSIVAVGLLLAALALSPPDVHGEIGEVDSEAFQAYQKKKYEDAIEAYQKEIETAKPGKHRAWLNLGLGSAAYNAGDLALAKEAFSETLIDGNDAITHRAHYNLGNALYKEGEEMLKQNAHPQNPAIPKDDATKEAIARQWQAALEHYQSALAADEGDENARYNSQVVSQRLEMLNEEPPEEENQDEEDEEEKDEEEEDQEPHEQEGEGNEENESSPQADGQDQEGQPNNDEPKEQEGQPDPQEPDQQSPQPPEGQGDQEQPQQPPPPPEPDVPDGELEGTPQQPDQQPPQMGSPEEREVNPETGFSPEEARRMLQSLSDEDTDVRPPIQMPMQAEKYKNW